MIVAGSPQCQLLAKGYGAHQLARACHPAPYLRAARPLVPSALASALRASPGLLLVACANTSSKDNAKDSQVAATNQAVRGKLSPEPSEGVLGEVKRS